MNNQLPPPLLATLQQHIPEAALVACTLPKVPEIRLWLLDDTLAQQPLDPDTTQALMDDPPYWVFCWASGQVLARYLLDNPELVAGKILVDVGPGSGVVAIAAALAGAARVLACDLDSQALQAVSANAKLNQVSIELVSDMSPLLEQAQILTAADILYDRENLPLLAQFRQVPDVLLADSRIRNLQEPGYQLIHQSQATTWPDLCESIEFNKVRLYRAQCLWL